MPLRSPMIHGTAGQPSIESRQGFSGRLKVSEAGSAESNVPIKANNLCECFEAGPTSWVETLTSLGEPGPLPYCLGLAPRGRAWLCSPTALTLVSGNN